MSGAGGSTMHLSTVVNPSHRKTLNHRNGSTKVDSSNHAVSSATLTPQKNVESLGSKIKKKVSRPYPDPVDPPITRVEANTRAQREQLPGHFLEFK